MEQLENLTLALDRIAVALEQSNKLQEKETSILTDINEKLDSMDNSLYEIVNLIC